MGARAVLRDLFCRSGAAYGRFDDRRAQYEPGLLGRTHEFLLYPDITTEEGRKHRAIPHRVLLYPGLGGVAATMWEQMARTLVRLRLRPSVALPRIVVASYSDTHSTAFVNTESAAEHLGLSKTRDKVTALNLRARQALLRGFVDLVHALSTLHGQGILHRNIRPESIEYLRPEGDDQDFKLRLARFEMSTLLANVFEGQSDDEDTLSELRRSRFRGQESRSLLCAAPERLASMFEIGEGDHLETDRSDVFSLGVIVWSWLMPPVDPARVDAVFEHGCDLEARKAIHDDMNRALVKARAAAPDDEPDPARVPPKLAQLLQKMLHWDPQERIGSHSLATELILNLDALLAPWDEKQDHTFFLGTLAKKASATLLAWGKLRHDPGTTAGRQELVDLIERDLRRAHIAFSPRGYAPWEVRDDPKYEEAKFVLIGAEYAWFCNQYVDHGESPPTRVDELLLIRFVLELGRHRKTIEAMAAASYVRQLPPVTVMPIELRETDPSIFRAVGQSWVQYLRNVQAKTGESPVAREFGRALRLLIDWQNAELVLRTFPFIQLETGSRGHAQLQVDEERRQVQVFKSWSPLPALLFRQQQIAMRPLFEGLGEGRTVALAIHPIEDVDKKLGEVSFADDPKLNASSDVNIIAVETPSEFRIPSQGWIRPADDFGSDIQTSRQVRALEELLDTPELLSQLAAPIVIADLSSRWSGVGSNLHGGADAIVRRMLGTEPLFAVQGPPGTGKTTVVATAVAGYLQRRRTSRVLVSAQSNYALDNLAEQIMAKFAKEDRPIAYRVTSARGLDERVSLPMREYELDRVTSRVIADIEAACRRRLADREFSGWRKLDEQLQSEIASHRIEVRERIQRAASLVFATCLSATADNVSALDEFNLFDWVIVEEAAKCWLTEMAIPLLRGTRWTLVGDHKQLPAFRRDEMGRLLETCANSGDRALRTFGDQRKEFERAYDFFEHLFDTPPSDHGATAALKLQFRMPEVIADIVGRTFYPVAQTAPGAPTAGLETADTKKRVPCPWHAPDWLKARHPLVWVDTTDAECQEKSGSAAS